MGGAGAVAFGDEISDGAGQSWRYQSVRDLGYVGGQNIRFEFRSDEGQIDAGQSVMLVRPLGAVLMQFDQLKRRELTAVVGGGAAVDRHPLC